MEVKEIKHALAKQIPDMKKRGVVIQTSCGDLRLDEPHSKEVATFIEKLLGNGTVSLPPALMKRAVELVAWGYVDDEEIAKNCGITPRILTFWKQQRDFQEDVRTLKHELLRKHMAKAL